MFKRKPESGFSLIELLLVIAIIGILSGIAIPAYMGQRRRARVVGDAQSNAKVLHMLLEQSRADKGIYGTKNATASWTYTGTAPTASTSPAPTFAPKGNTRMNYLVAIGSSGLTYTLTVQDPSQSTKPTVLTMDQTGVVTVSKNYQ